LYSVPIKKPRINLNPPLNHHLNPIQICVNLFLDSPFKTLTTIPSMAQIFSENTNSSVFLHPSTAFKHPTFMSFFRYFILSKPPKEKNNFHTLVGTVNGTTSLKRRSLIHTYKPPPIKYHQESWTYNRIRHENFSFLLLTTH